MVHTGRNMTTMTITSIPQFKLHNLKSHTVTVSCMHDNIYSHTFNNTLNYTPSHISNIYSPIVSHSKQTYCQYMLHNCVIYRLEHTC